MKEKIHWLVSGLVLALLAIVFLPFPVWPSQAEKPVTLIANWYGSSEHMRVKNHHVALCGEIERRTNGRVKFEHYYGDALCKITDYPGP